MNNLYKEQLLTIAQRLREAPDTDSQMVSAILFTTLGALASDGHGLESLFNSAADISKREIARLRSCQN